MKTLRIFFVLGLVSFISLNVFSGNKILFEENKGQWHSNILFKSGIKGGSLFLERNCFTFNFVSGEDMEKIHYMNHHPEVYTEEEINNTVIRYHAYKVHFLHSREPLAFTAGNKRSFYKNYFIGNDPAGWASEVGSYEDVLYTGLYEHIDLKIYSTGGNLKYDFIIDPGADLTQLEMEYEGLDNIYLQDGNLYLITSIKSIIEQKPYACQYIDNEKVDVHCSFILDGNRVTFEFPEGYDRNYRLVIDPVVIGCTFAGTTGSSIYTYGHCGTYDNQGNIYGGGTCMGTGYPVTTGAYDQTYNGGTWDIAISKFNDDASALVWATYIGGSSSDYPHSLFVNDNNELYVYGCSASSDYPCTAGCYDNTYNGGDHDIVVSKLNANGTVLMGSTYMGGSGDDGYNSVYSNYGDHYRGEVYAIGDNCYVASYTSSNNFPATGGAFQTTAGAAQDGVVFKLTNNLGNLAWSTYIGGDGDDAAYGIRPQSDGSVYVTGSAGGNTFPSTAGTAYPTYQGGQHDGYIAHITNNGANANITFFGTDEQEQSFFIDLDSDGFVYIFGISNGNIPVTPAGTWSVPNTHQFIAKLDNGLNTHLMSTVYGSDTASWDISPSAFLVDDCGNIYCAGHGGINVLSGMPTTADAFYNNGGFHILILEPDASDIFFGTCYGGDSDHADGGTSRFDPNGNIYLGI